jgi:hypothetical protein
MINRFRNIKVRTLTQADRPGSLRNGASDGRYGTRLRLGGNVADIVPDCEDHPLVHHSIVQRVGSPQILCLGQAETLAEALEHGHTCLEDLAAKDRKKCLAIYESGTAKR